MGRRKSMSILRDTANETVVRNSGSPIARKSLKRRVSFNSSMMVRPIARVCDEAEPAPAERLADDYEAPIFSAATTEPGLVTIAEASSSRSSLEITNQNQTTASRQFSSSLNRTTVENMLDDFLAENTCSSSREGPDSKKPRPSVDSISSHLRDMTMNSVLGQSAMDVSHQPVIVSGVSSACSLHSRSVNLSVAALEPSSTSAIDDVNNKDGGNTDHRVSFLQSSVIKTPSNSTQFSFLRETEGSSHSQNHDSCAPISTVPQNIDDVSFLVDTSMAVFNYSAKAVTALPDPPTEPSFLKTSDESHSFLEELVEKPVTRSGVSHTTPKPRTHDRSMFSQQCVDSTTPKNIYMVKKNATLPSFLQSSSPANDRVSPIVASSQDFSFSPLPASSDTDYPQTDSITSNQPREENVTHRNHLLTNIEAGVVPKASSDTDKNTRGVTASRMLDVCYKENMHSQTGNVINIVKVSTQTATTPVAKSPFKKWKPGSGSAKKKLPFDRLKTSAQGHQVIQISYPPEDESSQRSRNSGTIKALAFQAPRKRQTLAEKMHVELFNFQQKKQKLPSLKSLDEISLRSLDDCKKIVEVVHLAETQSTGFSRYTEQYAELGCSHQKLTEAKERRSLLVRLEDNLTKLKEEAITPNCLRTNSNICPQILYTSKYIHMEYCSLVGVTLDFDKQLSCSGLTVEHMESSASIVDRHQEELIRILIDYLSAPHFVSGGQDVMILYKFIDFYLSTQLKSVLEKSCLFASSNSSV